LKKRKRKKAPKKKQNNARFAKNVVRSKPGLVQGVRKPNFGRINRNRPRNVGINRPIRTKNIQYVQTRDGNNQNRAKNVQFRPKRAQNNVNVKADNRNRNKTPNRQQNSTKKFNRAQTSPSMDSSANNLKIKIINNRATGNQGGPSRNRAGFNKNTRQINRQRTADNTGNRNSNSNSNSNSDNQTSQLVQEIIKNLVPTLVQQQQQLVQPRLFTNPPYIQQQPPSPLSPVESSPNYKNKRSVSITNSQNSSNDSKVFVKRGKESSGGRTLNHIFASMAAHNSQSPM